MDTTGRTRVMFGSTDDGDSKGGRRMGGKRSGNGTTLGLRPLTRRDLERRFIQLTEEIAAHFSEVPPERMIYLGQEIYPRPVDTRLFIRLMSRHLSLN